jgi:phage tail-like protein
MSQKLPLAYRFASEAQWSACLFAGADRDSREARGVFRPFAPYAGPPIRYQTRGGAAPATTNVGEILWRDDEGRLNRLEGCEHRAVTAPSAIAGATRLVATSSALWAISHARRSLQSFDPEILARQLVVDIANAFVLDIAGDGHDGLFVLLERHGGWEIARYDCAGHLSSSVRLEGLSSPSALAYLQRTDCLIVLADKSSKIYWFAREGGPAGFSIPVSAIRPCFGVSAFGGDGRGRLALAGSDGAPFGGLNQLLTLDAEGNLLGDVVLDETATGVAADRAHLVVTTAHGLQQFNVSQSVSRESVEVRAELITPMLQSSVTDAARRWLRVEATVRLPPGCTIEISYASTDDVDTRAEALRLVANQTMPASKRMSRLRDLLGEWQTIAFHGSETAQADESIPFTAPIFDVRGQYLWVSIALIASPGGGIPVLSELAVLYPGNSLMENLPAIYRRAESQPGSFLRSLVGVLETTTQTIDARIADMGRHVNPQTASGKWLDFIASWLGLPWDDALSLDQKRSIALRAADIAKGRGTRAGLEALLESLMPGRPRRFRVVDTTADFDRATVGGDACSGSPLPALLGGLPSTATELGNKAILGKARLPCPDSTAVASRRVGRVRIDVAADAGERAKWEPWLRALVDDMMPVMARTELRWLSATAFRQDMQLDDALQLEEAPVPHLGTDAVTGIARLPGRRGISLSGPGVDSNSPLY